MNRLAVITLLGVLLFVAPQARGQGVQQQATRQATTPQVLTNGATPATNSSDQCPPPSAVVDSFLGFTVGQAAQFGQLLTQFQTTVHGLQTQIAARQAQVENLLNQPNPNPAVIGTLIVQIHALQQQAAKAVQSYQSLFAGLLTRDQIEKIQALTQASQLQPVLGSFVALYLVPGPSPLPCQKE
jgi:hypothetical protein